MFLIVLAALSPPHPAPSTTTLPIFLALELLIFMNGNKDEVTPKFLILLSKKRLFIINSL